MTSGDSAAVLIEEAPCSSVLPAGAGKTQLLARASEHAVKRGLRVLLLTHTHAGVQAMRERLDRLQIPHEGIHLYTLSAWADRWCSRYPVLTASVLEVPDRYRRSFLGATLALTNESISKVVSSSWDIVLVDEYQDCTEEQHAMVTALRLLLPVVIVGDPLQSVFGFGGARSVTWDDALFDAFPLTEVANEPHRWKNTNVALGQDLLHIRSRLLVEKPIDLRSYDNIDWQETDFKRRVAICKAVAAQPGSSLVIQQHRTQCVKTARNCGGLLTALEDLEARDLVKLATEIDGSESSARIALLFDAAENSIAKLPAGSKKRFTELAKGDEPNYQNASKLGPMTSAALRARESGDLRDLLALARSLTGLPGVVIARAELWQCLEQALTLAANSTELLVAEAVTLQRNALRRSGRKVVDRTVATPLLVKGLEFDNVLVLDAEQLSTEELYVSLTRACVSLVVRSNSPMLNPTPRRRGATANRQPLTNLRHD